MLVSPGRNLLHNGDMRINQMGTQTGVGATSNTVSACDRFNYSTLSSASGRLTSSREAATGGVDGHSYWLKSLYTTADASPSSLEAQFINNPMEDGDVQRYLLAADGTLLAHMVSFDVIAHIDGASSITFPAKMGLAVRASGSTERQYVADVTIAAADTWERVSVAVPTDATVDNIANNVGGTYSISFGLYGGSGRKSSTGAWEASGTDVSVAGDNWADATNNYVGITNVKIEVGSTATDFESPVASTELNHCQRFWQSSYDMGVTPGTVTDVGRENRMIGLDASNQNYFRVNYPVVMRTSSTPDVTIYTPSAGTAAKYDNETDTAEIAITLVEADAKGFTIKPTSGTNQNLGDWITFHWTADERN